MSQQRPQLPNTSSSNGLLPSASLQNPDSYFKEPRGRLKRPRLYEKASDSLVPRLSSRSRSPKAHFSPSIEDDVDEFSSKRSSATDPVDEYPTSYSSSSDWQIGEPPRPAKPGNEWVWYPEPYEFWAERPEIPRAYSSFSRNWPWKRISFTRKFSSSSGGDKLQQNAGRQGSNAGHLEDAERRNSIKTWHQDPSRPSSEFSRDTPSVTSTQSLQQRFVRSIQFLSPKSPKLNPSVGEEGFFKAILPRKGKKNEGRPSIAVSEVGMLSRTAILLDDAAEVLEHVRIQNSEPSKLLMDPHPAQQRRGLFHLHRRYSSESHNSLLSLTDSVRELLMGKTPVVTPYSEGNYIGSSGNIYEKVNFGTKDAPTYLPSEATRISTPPDETPGTSQRNFLFDVSPPTDESKAPSSVSDSTKAPSTKAPSEGPIPVKRAESSPQSGRQSPLCSSNSPSSNRSHNRIAQLRDRWETGTQREKEERKYRFELDVPEHFPTSPLCPRNPSHKSGGTGICVYHGRNLQLRKMLSIDAQSKTSTGEKGAT